MRGHGVEAAVGVEQVVAVFKVSKGTEFVSSGGVAIGTTVFNGGTETRKFSGGTEIVSSGGVTSRTTIEGGKLEIDKGGKAAGLVTFSGGDGELVIDARAMPGATISGFAATDKIVLSAIRYSTSDSVSVNAPGIVTVSAGGKDYNLHIAGATVGETDFSFGAGSILTRGAVAQPGFLRPAASAAMAAEGWGRDAVVVPAVGGEVVRGAAPVMSNTSAAGWLRDDVSAMSRDFVLQAFGS